MLKAPRILLFDEATSALDSHTEGGVMDALRELAQVSQYESYSWILLDDFTLMIICAFIAVVQPYISSLPPFSTPRDAPP